ncbi:hypothetical protein [Arthrobacter sp. ZBG10]|uniref:hypothetical protein n=1 Tax=Arthrobacter sp. ZBG10 TaxID=1676590 RepID=UPI001E63EDCF|nr:hypothetical protein [Arthrobacter sp. ZBG10]
MSVPLVQVSMPWLNAMWMGRFRKSVTHSCCSPLSAVQPDAPVAMSFAARVSPVIVALALKGPHGVVTLSWSSPLTEANAVVTLPAVTQGSSALPDVPETLLYVVQGAVGRKAAHISVGGVVLVEPAIELVGVVALVVDVAESGELVVFRAGTSVPGPPVLGSPHDARSSARNKDGTMLCHNQLRFIVLP